MVLGDVGGTRFHGLPIFIGSTRVRASFAFCFFHSFMFHFFAIISFRIERSQKHQSTMAEVVEATAVVAMNKETVGAAAGNEAMDLKTKLDECIKAGNAKPTAAPTPTIDLPQDYLPFSPTHDSLADACSAAKAHTWVSPNKSDEVPSSLPSSKESSPDVHSGQTSPSAEGIGIDKLIDASEVKYEEESQVEVVDLDAEYDADFEPIAKEEETPPELDLSILGQSYLVSKIVDEITDTAAKITDEVVLSSSQGDFVKIIHGDKHVMMAIPSEVSCSNTLHLLA